MHENATFSETLVSSLSTCVCVPSSTFVSLHPLVKIQPPDCTIQKLYAREPIMWPGFSIPSLTLVPSSLSTNHPRQSYQFFSAEESDREHGKYEKVQTTFFDFPTVASMWIVPLQIMFIIIILTCTHIMRINPHDIRHHVYENFCKSLKWCMTKTWIPSDERNQNSTPEYNSFSHATDLVWTTMIVCFRNPSEVNERAPWLSMLMDRSLQYLNAM